MGEYAECTSHNPPDRGLYTEIDLCQSADYVSLESRFAVFIAALIWLFSALVKRQMSTEPRPKMLLDQVCDAI
jgi:hypothetical protein